MTNELFDECKACHPSVMWKNDKENNRVLGITGDKDHPGLCLQVYRGDKAYRVVMSKDGLLRKSGTATTLRDASNSAYVQMREAWDKGGSFPSFVISNSDPDREYEVYA